MREIEIKVQVESLDGVRKELENKGADLSDSETHHDIVWGLPDAKSGSDAPWLRLRTEKYEGDTRYIFTLKRSVTGQLDSIEHETEISDPDAIEGMVHELGFTLYSDITKTRQKAHKGNIEICLDTVDGLGQFVEAEKITDGTEDYQAVVDELWALFQELGIDKSREITDGYDVLVNKKLGKE